MNESTKQKLPGHLSPEQKKIVNDIIELTKSGNLKWQGKKAKLDLYDLTLDHQNGLSLKFEKEDEVFTIWVKPESSPIGGINNTPLIQSLLTAWQDAIKRQEQEMLVDIQKTIDGLKS
jgi:hypothetical protein